MGMYDQATFDKSLVPVHLKKDVRDLIEVAVMLGWKMHLGAANAVTIVSHDERKKLHFSASGRASTGMNRLRREVVKYADPKQIEFGYAAHAAKDPDLGRLMFSAMPTINRDTVVDHRAEIEAEAEVEERRREQREEIRRARKERERRAQGRSESEPIPAYANGSKDQEAKRDRTIVSEQPMTAKASEGRGYESKVAVERHWSDGSVDYKCVDCDYHSDNRLSIRAHRSGAKHSARGRDRASTKVEVPLAATYKPRENRIKGLAEWLKEAIEGGASPEEIARHALTWMHEQTRHGTGEAAEREPMTAEETLARIRLLLDDGSQQKIVELTQQIDDLNTERTKLNERVEELESFIELATTLRREGS
jgi:hypothetical protein